MSTVGARSFLLSDPEESARQASSRRRRRHDGGRRALACPILIHFALSPAARVPQFQRFAEELRLLFQTSLDRFTSHLFTADATVATVIATVNNVHRELLADTPQTVVLGLGSYGRNNRILEEQVLFLLVESNLWIRSDKQVGAEFSYYMKQFKRNTKKNFLRWKVQEMYVRHFNQTFRQQGLVSRDQPVDFLKS